jgi:hypothetical protein
VLLISIPYFLMMAVDLKHCGYRRSDVFGLYGFNLVLLGVNLAGVGASLLQVLIGGRPAFKRTPKVHRRTTPGLTFVLLPYIFVAFSVWTLLNDLDRNRWVNVALAGLNAFAASYAIIAYIGVGHSIVDIWRNVLSWLYKPQRSARAKRAARRTAAAAVVPDSHWSTTLAYAPADGVRRAERRSASSRSGTAADRRSGDAEDRRSGPGRRETDVATYMGRRADDRPPGRADDPPAPVPALGRRAEDPLQDERRGSDERRAENRRADDGRRDDRRVDDRRMTDDVAATATREDRGWR